MKKLFVVTAALALLGLCISAQAITIETVAIGDAGNAANTATGYGSVGYNYSIGKYEVTAGQYTAFLNAVANVSDTYGLYNSSMWSDTSYGCKIQQTSVSGGYSYTVDSAYANRPVSYVSYWDSCRFANWLGNGQGSNSTETGAYTLNGYTGNDGRTIQRNAGWEWAVTSEDEWYKAAYYMGDDAYSLFANGTSVPPNPGTASNYNGVIGHTWDGTINGALEQNGTKDMMGNVWEWNGAILYQDVNHVLRCFRGGSFNFNDFTLESFPNRSGANYPNTEGFYIGFRVSEVPEPSSIIALLGGLVGFLGMRRRRA